MKTTNAKWHCPYCVKSIYGYGSEFELQEFIKEHIASHELPVTMVTILEGNGKDDTYREVKYFYDDENDNFIGKLDPASQDKE